MRMHDLHHGTAAWRRRLYFDDGHYAASPEKLSSCPAFSDTYAFLTWSRRPIERPNFLTLPFWTTVETFSTSTLKSSSTAALISGFVASRSTLNSTWLFFSATLVAFSEMIGASRMVARRFSAVFFAALMRTSP